MVICVSWIRRQKEEKSGFKYSCIWNWLVCFVSAAQNRALTTISKIFQGFSWFCRFFCGEYDVSPSPFLFHCFLSFSLWFFVSAAGCTRTKKRNKPQNGLFFLLHLFVSAEKEIIKLQRNNELKKCWFSYYFNQKTTQRYKLPTYDLASWAISFRMAQIHYVYTPMECVACCLFLESKKKEKKHSSRAEWFIQVWLYKII